MLITIGTPSTDVQNKKKHISSIEMCHYHPLLAYK
jgi:hypothetical protein